MNRKAGAAQRPSQGSAAQRPKPSGSRKENAGERQGQGQRQDNAGERQGQRQGSSGDRQEKRNENREDWQDHASGAREDRQDFAEDQWDDHRYGYGYNNTGAAFVTGVAVGAAVASPTYVTTLPCAGTTVVVNGSTSYYQCGTTWYSRGYQSGTVVYISGGAPPGY